LETRNIPLKKIKVGSRLRQVEEDKAREIAQSIKVLGTLLHPLVVDMDFNLIAGAHRIRALEMLGETEAPVHIVDFDFITSEIAQIDENISRAELDDITFGEFLIRRDDLLEILGLRTKIGSNQYGSARAVSARPLKTTNDLAGELGVSRRTYQIKKMIANRITEGNRTLLKGTDWARNTYGLVLLSKQEEYIQDLVVDELLENHPFHRGHTRRRIKDVIKEVRIRVGREEVIEGYKKLRPGTSLAVAGIKLIHGDFTDPKIRQQIPNEIDLIFTDPEYKRDALPQYEWVAELGKEKLKEGGAVVVYCVPTYLGDIIPLMNKHLNYFYTLLLTADGYADIDHKRGFFVQYKFLLMYIKGETSNKPGYSFAKLRSVKATEKVLHHYVQAVSDGTVLYDFLTKPGDLVVDCLMGWGTAGIAAIQSGRKFVGIEIVKGTYETAKMRLESELEAVLTRTKESA